MRNMVSKAVVASVAALALGASLVATAEPAAAQWHGGGGGWHGGGGGWHGGGWRGAGWGGRGVWHNGYWRGGNWYGGWWGPAAVGALAVGALAAGAAYPYYGGYGGYDYGYPNGCVQNRPLYAPNGAWIGNGPVNVCQ